MPEPICRVLMDSLETTLFAGGLSGKIYLLWMEQSPAAKYKLNNLFSVISFASLAAEQSENDGSASENCAILQGGQEAQVTAMALSMDARYLMTSDTLGWIHLWDLSTMIRLKYAKLNASSSSSNTNITPIVHLQCSLMPKFLHRPPTQEEKLELQLPHLAPLKKQLASPFEKSICHKRDHEQLQSVDIENIQSAHFHEALKGQYVKLQRSYTALQQKVLNGIFASIP